MTNLVVTQSLVICVSLSLSTTNESVLVTWLNINLNHLLFLIDVRHQNQLAILPWVTDLKWSEEGVCVCWFQVRRCIRLVGNWVYTPQWSKWRKKLLTLTARHLLIWTIAVDSCASSILRTWRYSTRKKKERRKVWNTPFFNCLRRSIKGVLSCSLHLHCTRQLLIKV